MRIVRCAPIPALMFSLSLSSSVPELSQEGGRLSDRGAVFVSDGAPVVGTAARVPLENPELMLRDETGHAFPSRVLSLLPPGILCCWRRICRKNGSSRDFVGKS